MTVPRKPVGNALRGVPGIAIAVSVAASGTPRRAFPTDTILGSRDLSTEPNMRLPTSYLKEPITLEGVEALYDFRTAHADFREDWHRLLEKRQEGDELWTFELLSYHYNNSWQNWLSAQ